MHYKILSRVTFPCHCPPSVQAELCVCKVTKNHPKELQDLLCFLTSNLASYINFYRLISLRWQKTLKDIKLWFLDERTTLVLILKEPSFHLKSWNFVHCVTTTTSKCFALFELISLTVFHQVCVRHSGAKITENNLLTVWEAGFIGKLPDPVFLNYLFLPWEFLGQSHLFA